MTGLRFAVFVVVTIIISGTFGIISLFLRYTITVRCQLIAMLHWTCAAAAFIDNQTPFEGTHAMAGFVNAESLFNGTWGAIIVQVKGIAWRADAFAIRSTNVALIEST